MSAEITDKKQKVRFVASYSGGKDSLLAIQKAVEQGLTLQALMITYNTDKGHSWFHGIPKEILQQVEQQMGIPVCRIETSGQQYAENFEKELKRQKEYGAEICVFGDIDIQEHRDWCEQRCEAVGIKACFPLWKQSRKALVSECIKKNFVPYIIVVDTKRMDARFVGKILTEKTAAEIEQAGVDICGENGEYHTFVADCPLFRQPISLKMQPMVMQGEYAVMPLAQK